MDQTNIVTSIYLIALFIVKESSDVFHCFWNCARVAIFTTALAPAIVFLKRKAVARIDFGQAFAGQDIAYIYWTSYKKT